VGGVGSGDEGRKKCGWVGPWAVQARAASAKAARVRGVAMGALTTTAGANRRVVEGDGVGQAQGQAAG